MPRVHAYFSHKLVYMCSSSYCSCMHTANTRKTQRPMVCRAGRNVTIQCPEGLQLNVHSSRGAPLVEEAAELAFEGCDVMTVASRAAAATGPMPPTYLDDYMGASTGTLRFVNSRLLLPSEVSSPPLLLVLYTLNGFHISAIQQTVDKILSIVSAEGCLSVEHCR